ncbi:MAG: alpha/beta hydrolase [Thermoplasmatota archaeon]
MPSVESRSIIGPTGTLDSRWHGPPDGPPVLLLHPHPFHGGSMGTRLIYDLAKALAADGRRVVRFDFRGVGRSEGTYDRGNGELEDALAVYDVLAAEAGREPTVVGFSFGGAVATALAAQRRPPLLVLVATPAAVRDSDLRPVLVAPEVACPVHFVYGSEDELVPQAAARELAGAFPRVQWHILGGADHFLTPTHLPRSIAAVQAALAAPAASDAPL